MKGFGIQKPPLTLPQPGDIGSERNLHYTQPFSPEQTMKRRWVTKHSHCSPQVPLDVMQVTTLKEQLRLGSELFDWYWNAASVPFGQLLIDLSPRTDDRLRYCTNSGTVPWKIYIPECLEQFCTLNDEGAKFFYSPSVPVAFPQMQKPLSSVLPKIFYPYSMRMHCKSAQRKLANHEKTSRGKISRQKLVTTAKKNNLEAEKKRSVFRKTIATNSRHYTSRH